MIALEQLADGSISDRNFQKLMGLVVDTGGRAVGLRWGVDVWTYPGGTPKTSQKVVSHGLGRTPVVVLVCGAQLNGVNETIAGEAGSYTATTFTTQASLVQGFTPGAGNTNPFVWVAIG